MVGARSAWGQAAGRSWGGIILGGSRQSQWGEGCRRGEDVGTSSRVPQSVPGAVCPPPLLLSGFHKKVSI